MLYENCDKRDNVVDSVLRRPSVRIPGIAFDVGSTGRFGEKNDFNFRNASGYKIELKTGRNLERLPTMDICEVAWDALTLVLREGEQASYTAMCVPTGCPLLIEAEAEQDSEIKLYQNGKPFSSLELNAGDNLRAEVGKLDSADDVRVTVEILKGSVKLHALCFGDIEESRYNGFLEIEIPQV
jgi:hypothetical protein